MAEAQEILNALLGSLHDGMLVLDSSERLIYMNPAAQHLLGKEGGSLAGQPASALFASALNLDEISRSANSLEITLQLGVPQVVEVRVSPLQPQTEWGAAWLVVLHNITDHKQIETALQESETIFRSLFEKSPDAIILTDIETLTIVDCNQNACRINGYSHEAMVGQPINMIHQDESAQIVNDPAAREAMIANIRQHSAQTFEGYHRARDGSEVVIESSISIVTIRGREVLMGIDRDITARKQAERALRQANEHLATQLLEIQRLQAQLRELNADLEQRVKDRTIELARALKVKDEFLAVMSHELRTPLTGILGLAELLETGLYGPLADKQTEALQAIRGSGQHLLGLISDMLDYARIEAGHPLLEVSAVEVPHICQTSLKAVALAAQHKRLRVTFQQDLAVQYIEADEQRLKKILINLLNNAVKFTPEDGALGLEVTGDSAQGEACFTVWDTGPGIAPADQARLFQPFVQLDSSFARKYEGTGLGLAVVKRLAQLHGGRVTVESAGVPGRGSRFTVYLPWKPPAWASDLELITR
jgi:PAS domain S-box-containing protein